MDALDARTWRRLRQHLEAERCFGIEAVPVRRRRPTAHEEAGPLPDEAKLVAEARHQACDEARDDAGGDALFAGDIMAAPISDGQTTLGHAPLDAAELAELATLDRARKAARLAALDEGHVRGCTRCELCKSRSQTVFGTGDADADLMFVGEGPGQNEDEQGEPFVGRAGQKLNDMIKAMGLRREQVYIANVVKCRPPNNRTPTPAEAAMCWPYLQRQIAIIAPKVIVTLGGPAAKLLLNTDTGITRLRGTWHSVGGLRADGSAIPVMPTFHPAFLLRQYTPDNRRKVWSDLQAAVQRMGQAE